MTWGLNSVLTRWNRVALSKVRYTLGRMVELDERDINRPGGWLVEVRTLGGDPEYYKAYELDRTRAIELVRAFAFVVPTETCVAVKELHLHEFTGDKMMPGQVKRHWGKL